jgi:beta-galactosidase
MQAERESMKATGDDMGFVRVAVTDAAGTLCPRAGNRVRFTVAGPADLAAVDNGDATSVEPFAAPARAVFNGLCVVYLRSRAGAQGEVILRAEAEGLAPAEVRIQAE